MSRERIIALYEIGGYTREQLLREYDLTETALSRWIRQSRNRGSFKEKDNRTPEENALIALRKR